MFTVEHDAIKLIDATDGNGDFIIVGIRCH